MNEDQEVRNEVPSVETPVVASPETALTEKEILAAATNDPSLSPDEFQLGDKKFKVVHLPYDDYVAFLSMLQPFLEGLMHNLAEKANVSVPGIALGAAPDASSLITFCLKSLPDMACIVCKQTDSSITVGEVKRLGGTPFALAGVVLKQISKNKMIKDFSSFFALVTPLLKAAK